MLCVLILSVLSLILRDHVDAVSVVGNPFYTAPECLNRVAPYTFAADIFSYGLLVCELITRFPNDCSLIPRKSVREFFTLMCNILSNHTVKSIGNTKVFCELFDLITTDLTRCVLFAQQGFKSSFIDRTSAINFTGVM
ncbi:unnamed protein product [Trichobilharzia regenti]|nr:unnamed protein product [Trichobilharzia regenti]